MALQKLLTPELLDCSADDSNNPLLKTDELKDRIYEIEPFKRIVNTVAKDNKGLSLMILLRGIEEAIVELARERILRGPIHSYVGQEAVAVGCISQTKPEDFITSTHRGHGHYLARGGNITALIHELYGLPSGCNGGHGGSMHVADIGKGLLGANGIVGGGVPIACGLALAKKLDAKVGIVIVFFGDGAFNQGVVLESLNIAAFMKLPILFVCENNCFAQSTHIKEVTATSPVIRAEGFGIHSSITDGLKLESVSKTFDQCSEYVRQGNGPAFIQADTYRFHRHFVSERPKEIDYINPNQHKAAIANDPIFRIDGKTKSFLQISNQIKSAIASIKELVYHYRP